MTHSISGGSGIHTCSVLPRRNLLAVEVWGTTGRLTAVAFSQPSGSSATKNWLIMLLSSKPLYLRALWELRQRPRRRQTRMCRLKAVPRLCGNPCLRPRARFAKGEPATCARCTYVACFDFNAAQKTLWVLAWSSSNCTSAIDHAIRGEQQRANTPWVGSPGATSCTCSAFVLLLPCLPARTQR